MIPYLFNIGPLNFNLYGFFIAIGLLVFLWSVNKDLLTKKYLKPDQLTNITFICTIAGIIGGRILNIIQNFEYYTSAFDMIAIWNGGLSLQGSIIAIAITLPLYLKYIHVQIMPILDLGGLYAPLLQSISRLGCLCAGCCHGCPTNLPWAITYTHPDSYAILNVACHPTQIYSSLSLLILFFLLRFVFRPYLRKPGQLVSAYLIGSSLERILNDFFRAEHYEMITPYFWNFSSSQMIALCLLITGLVLLVITSSAKTKPYPV